MEIPFAKYQALGNDFILVKSRDLPGESLTPKQARFWCDRHFGVGADGVLILSHPEGVDLRMDIINSDGSIPEMCGNGLRCVAAWWLHQQSLDDMMAKVGTAAGVFQCSSEVAGRAVEVGVPMGCVDFNPQSVGLHEAWMIAEGALCLEEGGERYSLHLASTGNPHGVCVVEDASLSLRELAVEVGGGLGRHRAFLHGVNVSMVRVLDAAHVELVVFERGAGLTMACGTGACATVATLARLGLVRDDGFVSVALPGGDLQIQAAARGRGEVTMRGPAQHVFSGGFIVS